MPPEVTLYIDGEHEADVVRPIGTGFARRGCAVVETGDFAQPSEIGIYACHPNRFFDFGVGEWQRPPSDVAVLALHDLGQDNGADTGYFSVDSWHTFDYGLLPGRHWAELWKRAEEQGMPGPTHGMHLVGWPKADAMWADSAAHEAAVVELRQRCGLDDRLTLLLGCSWSDERQLDELLTAVDPSRHQVLARYPVPVDPDPESPWAQKLTEVAEIQRRTRTRAAADPRVAVSPDGAGVMTVVGAADVIVSNGSGLLYEAVLAGVPGISVRSWQHPAGRDGDRLVPATIDLDGVLSVETLGDFNDALEVVSSPAWQRLVQESSGRIVDPATRGLAADAVAELVLAGSRG